MGYVNLQEMARAAFVHIEKKEFDQAEAKLSYLLNINSEEPILNYYLGCMYHGRKQFAQAVLAFEKALSLKPDFDEAYNNISAAYRQLGRMDKCVDAFSKAIHIASQPSYKETWKDNPENATRNLADYYANLGSCFVAKGDSKTALGWLEKALEIYPKLPNAMWNAGLAYLELGEYEKGFEGYDYGDRIDDSKERSYHGGPMSTPWWQGPKDGVKPLVVVYGEQGLGDEIMFASILEDASKDARIILEAHPRLQELFRNSFPFLEAVYGTRKSTQVNWAKNYDIDAKIAIGSLGKFYRKKSVDFPGKPYLKSSAGLSYITSKIKSLPDKPLIGVSWKGGIGITNKSPRTIPLELFADIFSIDANFISLQYHSNARAEIDVYHEKIGKEIIIHWQDIVDDYDLTATLLTHLDCVVSVPQSVVHLAGAMGVKTYQLCPRAALWQMGSYGKNMPWYKCVENIWQKQDGHWPYVLQKLKEKLDANYSRVQKVKRETA